MPLTLEAQQSIPAAHNYQSSVVYYFVYAKACSHHIFTDFQPETKNFSVSGEDHTSTFKYVCDCHL